MTAKAMAIALAALGITKSGATAKANYFGLTLREVDAQ
jgi:hypothetical protein